MSPYYQSETLNMPSSRKSLRLAVSWWNFLLVVALLGTALACGGQGNDGEQGESRVAFTDRELLDVLFDSGYTRFNSQSDRRADDGMVLGLAGPETVWVEAFGFFHSSIVNPEAGEGETAFDIRHTEGSILLTGPVTQVGEEWIFRSEQVIPDGDMQGGPIKIKCDDVGPATVTIQSTGFTTRNGEEVGYSNSATLQFECVDAPPPPGGISPWATDIEALESYFDALTDRVREVSGVEAVGLVDALPLGRNRAWPFSVIGHG